MPDIYSKDNYYEAIFQLRPYKKEIYDFIIKQIEKNNVLISKEVKLKTGIDFYLTSRKFTTKLGKLLQKTFKGKSTVSKSLYGTNRMTSKLVYRVTVCFRLKEEPL